MGLLKAKGIIHLGEVDIPVLHLRPTTQAEYDSRVEQRAQEQKGETA